MNVAELQALFDAEQIDPDSYSLDGGTPTEAYVLEQMPSGWAVYYAERGLRTAEMAFESESEACDQLRTLVLSDPTTRRFR
ncbi:hypothetical protein [Jiangella alba]|uniref:Uncharacterized protein n=1 Tax=Jiangella alba TaxID=561176 RepID=A0A1H5MZP1_9ACTN|nr:hypothetical protein [Jiangella alba]SEE94177.1 hypothetical protein SAMN04488561_3529 [Jiangella alba]